MGLRVIRDRGAALETRVVEAKRSSRVGPVQSPTFSPASARPPALRQRGRVEQDFDRVGRGADHSQVRTAVAVQVHPGDPRRDQMQ
jgi:hypothetical protein